MKALKNLLQINEKFTKVKQSPKLFNSVKDNIPLIPDYNYMADLLFLPTDKKGYKFALIIVDLATDEFDIEAIKDKNPETILKAMLKMFKRPYIKKPYSSIRTDGGTEFKGIFNKYLFDNDILHKTALPGRHTQMANVENLNRTIGRLFNGYMNAEEEKTGKVFKEWTNVIDTIRVELNSIRKKEVPKDFDKYDDYPFVKSYETNVIKGKTINTPIESKFKVDDLVYRKLDEPENALGHKQNTKNFREGDYRWDKTPRKITQVLNYTGDVPFRYMVNGIKNASYTDFQLKKASERVEKFKVKKILNKRMDGRKVLYLVWWYGELKKNATWQPRKELIKDIPDIINDYEENN